MAHAPDNAVGQQAGQCAVFRRGCLAEDARQFWRVDERHLAEEVEHLPVGECHGGSLPECMGDRQPARKARGDDAPRCRCGYMRWEPFDAMQDTPASTPPA